MPRTISLYLDPNQAREATASNAGNATAGVVVYKTNLQAAQANYFNILKSLTTLVLHLLFIRNDRRKQKRESAMDSHPEYQLKYDPSSQLKQQKPSMFLYRQYEQDTPNRFYTNDTNNRLTDDLDSFRGEYLYRATTNQVYTDRSDELFSIFCEYAVRDSCVSLVHVNNKVPIEQADTETAMMGHAGPRLGCPAFVAMLMESGVLLEEDEEKMKAAQVLFQQSILSGGKKAYFGDFLEALLRWSHFSNSTLQMVVEIVVTATEVETWPALHQRHWKDHVLFLRNTCDKDKDWTDVPPETRSWIYLSHKTGVA